MIAAMTQNRIIGKNNDLPWHLPDDFKYFKDKTLGHHFKDKTLGHHVILGRKNYESLPTNFRPLPNRTNIILTRNKKYKAIGAVVMCDLEDALNSARKNGDSEPFIIGGGEIYELGLNYATRIYLTQIHTNLKGDTIFPDLNKNEWKEISRVHHPADERHKYAFDFVIYDKK